ncbi:MAG: hypothetical protein LBH96_06205 [Candidatus Peribacteria bacterium]|jgi:hypothetical protein|nr:hypothetical protein [Candidatus Peribacteria bacterium]
MKKLLVLSAFALVPFTLAACGSEKVEETIDSGEDMVTSESVGEELIEETINEVEGLVDEVESGMNDFVYDEVEESTETDETGIIYEENIDVVTPEIIVE